MEHNIGVENEKRKVFIKTQHESKATSFLSKLYVITAAFCVTMKQKYSEIYDEKLPFAFQVN